MMELIINQFHFLRPEWLYAIIPCAIIYILLKLQQTGSSNWEKAIDPGLLSYLLETQSSTVKKRPMALVLIAWLLASFALAGPVWEKTPQPIHEREDALVVVLDLTLSMYATDVKPSRLVRAQRKLTDLLQARDEGVTGLIVFAGDAHAVSPLTDDVNTIVAMIPALMPRIMPAPGSRLTPALQRSIKLFHDAGVSSGKILVLTDEIRDSAEAQSFARKYRNTFPVSVMSVGTTEGAPIPISAFSNDNGFLKDNSGNIVIPKVDTGRLQNFANLAGGRYTPMTLTDEDIDYLLAENPLKQNETLRELERDFDIWFEEGPWLLLLLLPVAALAFRRGWLWCLALFIVFPAGPAEASIWDDLWQTRDQQAMQALKKGDNEQAATLFEDPAWKGSALYKGETFDAAAKAFSSIDSSEGKYNLANSLAKNGQYEEAIEAYDQSLTLNPDNEDALFNKNLVEELLKQQQQQQKQQGDQQEKDDQQDKDDQQQSENKDQQDQQDQDKQKGSDDQQQQEENEKQAEQKKTEEDKEENKDEPKNQQMAEDDAKLDSEEQQALKQWLRRVPDDPGGLLRRKFEQQHDEDVRNGTFKSQNADPNW